MASVETVKGPIDAGELGTTLIHEHLITTDEAVRTQWHQVPTLGTARRGAGGGRRPARRRGRGRRTPRSSSR